MELVIAQPCHLTLYREYIYECIDGGIERYDAALNNPRAYLQQIIERSKGQRLPDGWLPTTTYFCVESNVILGAIRFRDGTNQYVNDVIGHIGYETAPSARNRGVAKFMLANLLQLKTDSRWIITCEESNVASKQVIESVDAQFLNRIYDDKEDRYILRYYVSA